jgi:hypothetical protein
MIGSTIVHVEKGSPDSTIHTMGDGIWWAVTTVTSVGYGDTYPITPLGRTLGMILMISGVMLTGVILGFVTVTLFHSRDEYYWKRISNRLDRIEDKMDGLEKRQNFMVKSSIEEKQELKNGE